MKIIGHRGARGVSSENTIASIETAIRHGVDGVELDARVTKDGVTVLHHDPVLHDPAGGEVLIDHSNYADLLRHKPDLTALDMAIRAVQHRCQIMIELKPGVPAKQTIAIIHDRLSRGWRIEEFSIASYDPKILAIFRSEFPGIQLVVNELWSGIRATRRARSLETKRINMYENWLFAAYLRWIKKSGWQITVFPANKKRWHQRKSFANDPVRMKAWRPYLYAVITDRPDLYKKK